ncbi:MAG: hypothetical protein HKN35_15580 [Woeseia sp.]|nr:hypothetical protein [Woeseia sp.]NNE62314.1 hypothetical protein [Woeseia sp.]NNL54792.1 hypothetical protein [Woeseia sp.]
MTLFRLIALCVLGAGCSGEIYLRDGVTDGDTFYLPARALTDDDPVLQSWVSYSLTLSACKLAIGGDNPARVSSYDCELTARRHLVETWEEQRARGHDEYLDSLLRIRDAGWLPEYVATGFFRKHWTLPGDLNLAGYREFSVKQLVGHRPVTRLVGSWNYARNVRLAR